jgi:hypothetical protein
LQGTNLTDVVSVLAPPFERFFVEFDRIPNSPGLASWGVLFPATESERSGRVTLELGREK